MERTERAVVRLTEPHTEMTEAGAVDWPPLLAWLEQSVTEQVKRGQAGSGGAGAPINLEALALLQRIENGVRLMREALFLPIMRDLAGAIRETWDSARAFQSRGELEPLQWERITEAFPQWVTLIEQEWEDRARLMEITVPCPRCGTRWVSEETNGDMKRRSAIWIEFGEGRAPVAECRAADCEAIWAGWPEVAKLGYTLGANQDTRILEACGINIPGLLAQRE